MAATQDVKGKGEGGDQNFDYMFKLLIIGNSSVGKTSFLFRYADDAFTSAFVSTVGIDFKVKTVYKNDKRIKLQIWVWNIHLEALNTDKFKADAINTAVCLFSLLSHMLLLQNTNNEVPCLHDKHIF